MLWRISPYLEQLNNMIGMEKLKETLFLQIIYYLQGFHERSNLTRPVPWSEDTGWADLYN